MSYSLMSAASIAAPQDFIPRVVPVQGPLALHCKALLAVEVAPRPDVELQVIPHDSFVLSIQFARDGDPFRKAGERGSLASWTHLRELPHAYRPPGDCITLFALLTPLGAVRMLRGQAQPENGLVRLPFTHFADRAELVSLEDRLALVHDTRGRLEIFGHWLEQRLECSPPLPWQAERAARVAMGLMRCPQMRIDEAAEQEHVTRRQLERDFRRWMKGSPKHTALISRVQAIVRLAREGHRLASIAQFTGFADQAHMTRTVGRIAGVSPGELVRSARTAMSVAFHRATSGGIVYL